MSGRKYGKMNKKVVFYDTDKRFADLKIRLGHDKISQAQFFRSIVTGYIEQDEDILNFIDRYKNRTQTKKSINENYEISKLDINRIYRFFDHIIDTDDDNDNDNDNDNN